MGQINLKLESFEFSDYLNCWDFSLAEKIERGGGNFSRIFIHSSLIKKWELTGKDGGREINISFNNDEFFYSTFYCYDMNTGGSTLELGVLKKTENAWRIKLIENSSRTFKKIDKIYNEISENIMEKKTIGESILELNRIHIKDSIKKFRGWEQQANDEDIASKIDLTWLNREILAPTRRILEGLFEKKNQIIRILSSLEVNYQSVLNIETHNEELRSLPNLIKEIQELLEIFFADESNSTEEIVKINELLKRFKKIHREAEEFNKKHPLEVPSPFPTRSEREVFDNSIPKTKDKNSNGKKISESKTFIFLLAIAFIFLLSPLYFLFSRKKKKASIRK